MLRTMLAGALGAASAVAIAFLVLAVVSAVGGVSTMFDPERVVYGWEGARYGMLLFVVIGGLMVWPFPAISLVGVAVGVLVRRARRRWEDRNRRD
jgi:hypothetical protein